MKFSLLMILIYLLCACAKPSVKSLQSENVTRLQIDSTEFTQLLNEVARGWNSGNARLAADCFSEGAVYIEPPDKQLYTGRTELFEFFGGEQGRSNPMTMEWHHIVFDADQQTGMGEYTFGYKGKLTHGIVIVQISNGKINRWREYQYRTKMEWETFIGLSAFDL